MSAHGGDRKPMEPRLYIITLIVAAITLITVVGIVANIIIKLH